MKQYSWYKTHPLIWYIKLLINKLKGFDGYICMYCMTPHKDRHYSSKCTQQPLTTLEGYSDEYIDEIIANHQIAVMETSDNEAPICTSCLEYKSKCTCHIGSATQ